MHELSVCRALVRQACDVARDRGARRVVAVMVRIGALSGAEPALLARAFPAAAADTAADGARLHIERVALAVRCRECAAETEPGGALICGVCASADVVLTRGEECTLVSLDLAMNALSTAEV